MIAYIYRSPKKDEMYLYTTKRDDFSAVPEALLKVFGVPEFALTINLEKREKLARENIEKVREELAGNGFYLQMPPTQEQLRAAIDGKTN